MKFNVIAVKDLSCDCCGSKEDCRLAIMENSTSEIMCKKCLKREGFE